MHLTGFFQNAYITRDIDHGLAMLRESYGATNAPIRFEPDMILKTPDGDKPAQVRAALVWVDRLQLELIQPVAGFIDHYATVLPDDPDDRALHFHHVCVRRDDYAAMQAEIDATGLPRAFEAEYPGGYFVYLDARATLGHYLEYAWATPETWAYQGFPPDWQNSTARP